MTPPGGVHLPEQLQEIRSKISPQQTLWILSAGVLLLTFLAGVLLIQNPWQEKQRQLGSLSAEEEQRGSLLLSIANQGRTLQMIEQGRMLVGGSPVLTSHIARIAKETGVEIESVTPQPETALPPYIKFQIEVGASSKLQNLIRFLHALEKNRPLLVADEIEIQNPESSASKAMGAFGSSSPPKRSVQISKETRRVRLLISSYNRKTNR